MPRLTRTVVAITVALLGAPMADTFVAGNEARAESNGIDVGTQLMAVADVALHKAEIAKGSRVSVMKLVFNRGRLDGVAVALPDGHVVKVTMSVLHTFFRIVGE